jgi:hypothetical protein
VSEANADVQVPTAFALGATITCSDKPARICAKIIMWDVKILEVLLALKA